jgi:predicted SnoaL-like aldol condensation-catalyzing enzyme
MRLIIAIAAGAALLAACSPATQDTADAPEADAAAAAPQGASHLAAAAGTNCEAPAPTAVAVTGEMTREGQLALLAHPDPKLAANKRLVWDMWRTLLNGYHIDRAGEFIHPDYIQHNPMANTGLSGMQGFFRSLGRQARELPEAIPEGVVAVMAEGDLVTDACPRGGPDSGGRHFVSTGFDMVRIKDGLNLEHWDAAARP